MQLRQHYLTPLTNIQHSFVTQPNMYARGILFGKMKYELGDHSSVRCPELGLVADIEFKTKGYFGGTYNAIGGTIKNEKSGETLFELSGMWSGEMFAKNIRVRQSTNNHTVIADSLEDRKEGSSFRCHTRKTHIPNCATTRRARRARIAEIMV